MAHTGSMPAVRHFSSCLRRSDFRPLKPRAAQRDATGERQRSPLPRCAGRTKRQFCTTRTHLAVILSANQYRNYFAVQQVWFVVFASPVGTDDRYRRSMPQAEDQGMGKRYPPLPCSALSYDTTAWQKLISGRWHDAAPAGGVGLLRRLIRLLRQAHGRERMRQAIVGGGRDGRLSGATEEQRLKAVRGHRAHPRPSFHIGTYINTAP